MKNTAETSIRLDVIKFYLSISTHVTQPEVILEVAEIIIPALESPVNDSFYKIVSEALFVLSILIKKGAKPNQECRIYDSLRTYLDKRTEGGTREDTVLLLKIYDWSFHLSPLDDHRLTIELSTKLWNSKKKIPKLFLEF